MFRKKTIVMQCITTLTEEDRKKQEDELSKKFCCKVILLPANISMDIKIIK